MKLSRKPEQPVQEPLEERRAAADADVFKPSTFASRQAQAQARTAHREPVLVSMGHTSHWMKDRRGRDVYADAELYYEKHHPSRRYVRIEGDPALYPLFETEGRPETPQPVGTFSRRSVLPGRFQPSPPDEVHPV